MVIQSSHERIGAAILHVIKRRYNFGKSLRSAMPGTNRFLFGSFRVDPAEHRLFRGDDEVPLRPKTFAVLRHLLERAGRLVSKDELLEAVWGDTAVGDTVLKVSIRELREALEDDAKAPQFIETEHSAGYRFIGAVSTIGARG